MNHPRTMSGLTWLRSLRSGNEAAHHGHFGRLGRLGRLALSGLAVGALAMLSGCGGAAVKPASKKSGTSVIVIDNPRPKPRLAFGSLTLLMTKAQVQAVIGQPGWTATGAAPDAGTVTLTPPATDEAIRYDARFEGGQVIQLVLTFRKARTDRAAMRHAYARSKIQSDGTWAMTDPLRATLVLLRVGGSGLVATHLGATKDKAGVRAMLERYLGE